MAIQNDNTLVTKGDLKELYTDKIAPYLGGGISYYHTDRTGEELKSSAFKLIESGKADTPDNNDYGAVLVAKGSIIPFHKINGSFEEGTIQGTFKVPNGMRIEAFLSMTVVTGSPYGARPTNVRAWLYNTTDSVYCKGDNNEQLPSAYSYTGEYGTTTYNASPYAMGRNGVFQWTNNTGHTVELGFRIGNFNNSQDGMPACFRTDATSMAVKEIGRIVDPVKYVSNNSDLQETPVGNIISYMGNSVPKHYLACDGAEYTIGSYPELEAFIIDEFGSINYFGGDGSTTWAVPDLRGEFLRGTGTNSHENQGNGANVGIHQDATEMPYIQGSSGNLGGRTKDSNTTHEVVAEYKNVDSELGAPGNLKYASGFTNNVSNLTPDFTTRPTNTSVKYCIKYESTYHAFFSNAAYKVETSLSDGGTKAWNNYGGDNSGQICTPTLLEGDSSLIDAINKCFIVPIDGWYNISAIIPYSQKTPSNKSGWIMFFDISDNNKKIGLTNTLQSDNTANTVSADGEWGHMYCSGTFYLEKEHQIQIGAWRSANDLKFTNAKASFCLLTSNYNPTIVSADSVYSENEQMIGYWKDGKPLYQKTYIGNTPSSSGGVLCSISSLDTLVWAGGTVKYSNGNTIIVPQLTTEIFRSGTTNNILFAGSSDGWFNRPCYITFQYTKTTDTASSLQIENSLLLNRPDLWEVGTEYHFGGGLYGQRFTGTVATTTTVQDFNLTTLPSTTTLVNIGGTLKRHVMGVSYYDFAIPYNYENIMSANIGIDAGVLKFIVKNSGAGNIPYDVWVLYKK